MAWSTIYKQCRWYWWRLVKIIVGWHETIGLPSILSLGISTCMLRLSIIDALGSLTEILNDWIEILHDCHVFVYIIVIAIFMITSIFLASTVFFIIIMLSFHYCLAVMNISRNLFIATWLSYTWTRIIAKIYYSTTLPIK